MTKDLWPYCVLAISSGMLALYLFRRPHVRASLWICGARILAFLWRRRILAVCALVFMIGACLRLDVRSWTKVQVRRWGIERGAFVFYDVPFSTGFALHGGSCVTCYMDGPDFSNEAAFSLKSGKKSVVLPFWIPLATIMAWMVMRELWWHEKGGTPCPKEQG